MLINEVALYNVFLEDVDEMCWLYERANFGPLYISLPNQSNISWSYFQKHLLPNGSYPLCCQLLIKCRQSQK